MGPLLELETSFFKQKKKKNHQSQMPFQQIVKLDVRTGICRVFCYDVGLAPLKLWQHFEGFCTINSDTQRCMLLVHMRGEEIGRAHV